MVLVSGPRKISLNIRQLVEETLFLRRAANTGVKQLPRYLSIERGVRHIPHQPEGVPHNLHRFVPISHQFSPATESATASRSHYACILDTTMRKHNQKASI